MMHIGVSAGAPESLPESQARDIKVSIEMLLILRGELGRELSVNQALVFLRASAHPGTRLHEIARECSLNSSTISKVVASLTGGLGGGQRGLDVLDAIQDPKDKRCRRLYLTPKGKRIAEKLNVI